MIILPKFSFHTRLGISWVLPLRYGSGRKGQWQSRVRFVWRSSVCFLRCVFFGAGNLPGTKVGSYFGEVAEFVLSAKWQPCHVIGRNLWNRYALSCHCQFFGISMPVCINALAPDTRCKQVLLWAIRMYEKPFEVTSAQEESWRNMEVFNAKSVHLHAYHTCLPCTSVFWHFLLGGNPFLQLDFLAEPHAVTQGFVPLQTDRNIIFLC